MIIQSDFKPPAWLSNPHLQTLWPYFMRSGMKIEVRRERLELPDGDFIDLDWNTCDGGAIVVLLHGLSGSVNSHYAKYTLRALQRRGMRGVLMNFRGASGEPNRLPRGYHGGETGDFAIVMQTLLRREPRTPIAAVGFSLGGNVLLKWVGEKQDKCPLYAAVAVSAPLDLDRTTVRLSQGFSRLYQWHILKCLKRDLLVKSRKVDLPVDVTKISSVTSFRQFDDSITAPLHGFRNAAEYYEYSSARRFLGGISVPTLILHALDDPFIPASVLPANTELTASTTLELSRHGGHVGFVNKASTSDGDWLENRITGFLNARLHTRVVTENSVIPLKTAADNPGSQ